MSWHTCAFSLDTCCCIGVLLHHCVLAKSHCCKLCLAPALWTLSQLYKETAPLNKGGSRNEPSLIDEVGQGVAQVAQADVYAVSDNEESGLRDEECDGEGRGLLN
jgi:hypothetical protein